jgi:hypothetical protein
MGSSRLEEAANALGLAGPSATGAFYGELDGFPVQLATGLPLRSQQVLALFRFNAGNRAPDVAKALQESLDLEALGVAQEDLTSDEDSVVLTFPPSVLIGVQKQNVVEPRVRAVLEVLKGALPDNRKACRQCGASGGEPALLQGEVDRLCSNCIEEYERQTRVAEDVYVAYPVNLARGLAAALVAGAVGAALYGGLMILANKMFWLVAIVTGSCVGWAAVKGAGKVTVGVQAMAAVITVLSVLAGFLMFLGYLIDKKAESQGTVVDWSAFLKASPRLLVASGWNTLFSLAGGLVGASYATRRVRRPDFSIVEKAP